MFIFCLYFKNNYTNDKSFLKIGNNISKPFPTNQGARQGCVLSPLLFNLYMVDLTKELNERTDVVKISDDVDASCIIWADDVLLLSESECGLKEMLLTLETYCNDNKLTVNVKKTKDWTSYPSYLPL